MAMLADVRTAATAGTNTTGAPPLPADFPRRYRDLAYWCSACLRWVVAECPTHGRARSPTVAALPTVVAERERLDRRRAAQQSMEGQVEDRFVRAGPAVFALWLAVRRELRLSAADLLEYMELAQVKWDEARADERAEQTVAAVHGDAAAPSPPLAAVVDQDQEPTTMTEMESDPAAPVVGSVALPLPRPARSRPRVG